MSKKGPLNELLDSIDGMAFLQFKYGTPEYEYQQLMIKAAARFRRSVSITGVIDEHCANLSPDDEGKDDVKTLQT